MGVLSATRHVWSADNLPLACLIGQAITDLKLHRQDADRGEWFSRHPPSLAQSRWTALRATVHPPAPRPYACVETPVVVAFVPGGRHAGGRSHDRVTSG